jgi:hypothetical protein
VLSSSGRILTKSTPILRHLLSDLRNSTRTKLEFLEPCLPNEATHGPGRVANKFGTLPQHLTCSSIPLYELSSNSSTPSSLAFVARRSSHLETSPKSKLSASLTRIRIFSLFPMVTC